MTSADVRARLTHALRLDLIGPEPDEPQAGEVLPISPSRFYLTGFLAPLNAPASQKADDDEQGELELAAASGGAEDDDSTPEPPAAKRGQFPPSMGVSVLVPPGVTTLRVSARWGDHEPVVQDGVQDGPVTGEWKRTERRAALSVSCASEQRGPVSKPAGWQRRARDRDLGSAGARPGGPSRPAGRDPRGLDLSRQSAPDRGRAASQGSAVRVPGISGGGV